MILRTSILSGLAIALAGCVSHPPEMVAYIKGVQESPDYRHGYADGCDAANFTSKQAGLHRNHAAFDSDPEYRQGWMDASENCRPIVMTTPGTRVPY